MRLFIVSNRLPVKITCSSDGKFVFSRSEGGATGLKSLDVECGKRQSQLSKVHSGSRPFRAESGKVHVKETEYVGNTRYEGWETSHGACLATALTDSPVSKLNH